MSDFFVAPIVEGHGEVQAVPILLQRMLFEIRDDAFLRVNPALRVKAGSFLNDHDYFAKYLELAARKAKPHARGSVLILLDCDDDCPAKVGPELAARAAAVRGDVPIIVALAYREYETWFLAAANSQMPHGYNEPNDQPGFTSAFSFGEAAAIPSFARLRGKLHTLFAA